MNHLIKKTNFKQVFVLIIFYITSFSHGEALYDKSLSFEEILPEFDVKVNSFTVRCSLLDMKFPGFNDGEDEIRLRLLDKNSNLILSVVILKNNDLYKVSSFVFIGKNDLNVRVSYDEHSSTSFSLLEKGNLVLANFKVTTNGKFIYSSEEAILKLNRLTLSVMERERVPNNIIDEADEK